MGFTLWYKNSVANLQVEKRSQSPVYMVFNIHMAFRTHETEYSFVNLEFKLSVVKCGHVPISAHLQAQMKHLGTFIPLARSLTLLT